MEANDQIAMREGEEDNREFQDVCKDMMPHLLEREDLWRQVGEKLWIATLSPFANVRETARCEATELIRQIDNTPDVMRRALMIIRDDTSEPCLSGPAFINRIATNALK